MRYWVLFHWVSKESAERELRLGKRPLFLVPRGGRGRWDKLVFTMDDFSRLWYFKFAFPAPFFLVFTCVLCAVVRPMLFMRGGGGGKGVKKQIWSHLFIVLSGYQQKSIMN